MVKSLSSSPRRCFPDRITKGYDDPERFVLSEINGHRVKSLRDLVQFLHDDREPQITLKFAKASRRTHETMVFNRAELLESTAKIIEENGIRYPYSPDLRPALGKISDRHAEAGGGLVIDRGNLATI